ncbi:ABC transporter ATP-binding protein [Neptunicella sp. SCSIO 80796]|uniref:ATP-binding cassette ATPase Uup n=1 Tax=Neptunicella plasticusilytica TaxID=3117012 RepID=UPI003A4E5E72
MSTLLQLKNASLSLGHPPLLDGIELLIKSSERVCLVGRNGCGKSTLLKVIAEDMKLDDGQRIASNDVVISRLPQDPPVSVNMSLFDYVAEELADIGKVLQEYAHQTLVVAEDHSEAQLNKLEKLQQQLDHLNGWQFEQRIQQVLTQLQLQPDQQLSSLSGGWRRKAALARALVSSPDILLLDEPTNHLDIDMIKWLEKTIQDYQGAVVFVSHDRAFIRNIATRIVDLDRGKLKSYPGNYQQYLDKKAEDLQIEETQNALFDKKLSQEETWIRQGIKARRTRNEGRVRALKALRSERSERRNVQGKAKIHIKETQQSGKIVFEVEGLSYRIGDKQIVKDLDVNIMRGDKLALIGPNGCGKSTLIKLLLEQLHPDKGSVHCGTKLDIAYFDQHRLQLDPDVKLIDCIADGKREIMIDGRSKHVISYLQDFLFTPERVNVPVSALSGGEKNRLLLAKLLIKPSNLLILDEPTNDLDVETLELLEDTLSQYPGTVILVSHDREFVDNVVTSSLFFAGQGEVVEFIGGYDDIQHWYQEQKQNILVAETSVKSQSPTPKSSSAKTKKLSYKLQLELEQLPGQIEQMEEELQQMQNQVNDPEFFKQDASQSRLTLDKLATIETSLADAYNRWDELENMK